MKSIDFKSLLIGILGTALVMMLMGKLYSNRNPIKSNVFIWKIRSEWDMSLAGYLI